MGDARALRHEPAHGLVRARRAARRRGDHDARAVPVALRVVLYTAEGCGLCASALEALREVGREVEFELEVVDIGGDDELERRYRIELPVVEIDGVRAFAFFVDVDELRARVAG